MSEEFEERWRKAFSDYNEQRAKDESLTELNKKLKNYESRANKIRSEIAARHNALFKEALKKAMSK